MSKFSNLLNYKDLKFQKLANYRIFKFLKLPKLYNYLNFKTEILNYEISKLRKSQIP